MIWPFRRRSAAAAEEETLTAKKAKLEARLELHKARAKLHEVSQQTAQIEDINETNHFSESLTHAFGGTPS